MIRWLSSLIPSQVKSSIPAAGAPLPKPKPGYDAEKSRALSSFEAKTRAAYAFTMHGYGELAYNKLVQRPVLTPELVAYGKGPGSDAVKSVGQAMTSLADAAGDIEVPDGKGGLISVKEQLAQFRLLFPESAARSR